MRIGPSDLLARSRSWSSWLFVPLLTQFLVVNLAVYPAYARFIVQAGLFQGHSNSIFPVTWASALGLFLYSFWIFRWKDRLDLTRTIVYSLGLCFAATSLFEILWQNVGASQGIGNQQLEGQLINLSSIAFGFCSVSLWRVGRRFLGALNLYWVGWILWLADGYPQTFFTSPDAVHAAFVFNIALKVGSFVIFALLISRPEARGRSETPRTGAAPGPLEKAAGDRTG